MEKILIIEDEVSINNILKKAFIDEGFKVFSAFNGYDGLQIFEDIDIDIVLLDLMLPDISGLDVCKEIKGRAFVIMISAKNDIEDKLRGIEIGADDYITKPFDIREVKARVKSIIRRFKKDINEEGIYIDEKERIAKKDGVILKLNRKEFELLSLFYKNKGVVFSRDKLLERVWGYDYDGEERTVDVHIRRLRGKLNENKEGSTIETVFGIGYVMR